MDNRLLTQLEILKLSGEKPNFSKLGREYGIDRRTVKRYYDGYAGKPATRNKPSKLDQHEAIIRQKMAIRGATIKAVYEFLYGKYGESIGTYSNFRKYVTSRGITRIRRCVAIRDSRQRLAFRHRWTGKKIFK